MTRALPRAATPPTQTRASATSATPEKTPAERSPETLAHETALVANHLRADAGRLALITLRFIGNSSSSHPAISGGKIETPHSSPKKQRRPAALPDSPLSLAMLTTLATHLRPLIRLSDALVIEREGIAVLLRDPAPDGARIVAQRLREALIGEGGVLQSASAIAMREDASQPTLTVRVGYTTLDATGAVVNSGVCDEQGVAPIVTTSGGRYGATFETRFAAIFLHVWESCAPPPLTAIPATDSPALVDDPTTPESGQAQKERSLRQQAAALGVPFARLPTPLPVNCRRAITRELASELRAIPIGYARATLTVAMEHPCDAQAVNRLRQATRLTIFPVLGAADEISHALKQLKP